MKGRKASSNRKESMEEVEDSRFSSMMNAPLFKKTSRQEKKVLLDDRFKAVLTDDRFRTAPGAVVDKYGRKKKMKNSDRNYAAKELEEFYKIEENDDHNEQEQQQEGGKGMKKKGKGSKSDKEGSEERLDYLTKLARGEVDVSSSSSEEDDDDDDDSSSEDEDDNVSSSSSSSDEEVVEEEEEEGGKKKGALDVPEPAGEVEYGEESTHRLAVLNCDWEHLKASDIMMVLQSFCPVGRTVKEVIVYPSDFGLERMAEEEKFGPKGIWKQPANVNDETEEKDEESDDDEEEDGDEEERWEDEDDEDIEGDEEEEEDNEEEGDEDDLYDRVEYLGSDDEDDEDEELENEEDGDDHQGDKKRRQKEGDVRRQQGAVGLVFADDLKQKQRNSKKKKNQSDIDEVALREYELSKLKYYFAIVTFDSIETANIVYEECDGLELENSAMTFDLRFVPNEEDFSNRQVRDRCNNLPSQYSPPDFIVNALQHTKVQCSWDEGEKEREKKLTNISQWRQLQDSDFMQYIASDNSSDDEDDDNNEDEDMSDENDGEDEDNSQEERSKTTKKKTKGKKASNLRKLLLGDNAELSDEEEGESDDNEGNFHDMDGFGSAEEGDDFFLDEGQDSDAMNSESEEELPSKKSKKVNQKKSKKTAMVQNNDDESAGGDEDEMVLTYIPDADKDIQAKKKLEGLSPFELDQLKQKEKKKTKKEMRKAAIEAMKAEQEELRLKRLEEAKNLQKKEKLLRLLKNENGEEDDDEEGRLIVKDKNKKNKKVVVKSKAKKRLLQEQLAETQQNQKEEEEEDHDNDKQPLPKKFKPLDNFKVNTQDTRFAALFEGDARYGIDMTSSDFKATPGVQTILEEQRKRRRQREENGPKDGKEKSAVKSKADVAVKEGSNKEVNQLVDRLKNKFRG